MMSDNVTLSFVCSFYSVLCILSDVSVVFYFLPFVLWFVFSLLDAFVNFVVSS